MNVTGSNILTLAMSVMTRQSIDWAQYTGRTVDDAGLYVNAYDDAVTITGSVQPVPRKRYANLGLDFSKQYKMFWSDDPHLDADTIGIARNRSSDRFMFDGHVYEVADQTSWEQQDGWTSVMLVMADGYEVPL